VESKINYAAVGVFVIFFGLVGVVIVVWLIGSGRVSSNYKRYIIYTNSNISGLHVDSSVRYKGLDAGRVFDIRIDKKDPNYIKIFIEVRRDIPVNKHTVAHISSNGLTGIAYIDLSYSKSPPKLPSKIVSLSYPAIPVVPTTLQQIFSALPKTLISINKVSKKISKILDNRTILTVKRTIKNLEEVTAKLMLTQNKLESLLANSNRLVISLNRDAGIAGKVISSTNNMVYKTIVRIDNLTKTVQNIVNYAKNTTLKESFRSLKELENTLRQMKELLMEIRRNPSVIIRGRQETNPLENK